jgi:hypothetical protein
MDLNKVLLEAPFYVRPWLHDLALSPSVETDASDLIADSLSKSLNCVETFFRKHEFDPSNIFYIFYSNITSLSIIAKQFLFAIPHVHALAVCETHDPDRFATESTFQGAGYNVSVQPARIGIGKGTHGGEAFAICKDFESNCVDIDMLNHLADLFAAPMPFACRILNFKDISILFVVLYLKDSVGLDEQNHNTLTQLYMLVVLLGIPFICVGDFNIKYEDFIQTEWLSKFKAAPLHPAMKTSTSLCTDRVIDFGMISFCIFDIADSILPFTGVPWSPHYGFFVGINKKPRKLTSRVLCVPKALPLETFKLNWDELDDTAQVSMWNTARNQAKRKLRKHKRFQGVGILGTPDPILLSDPKYTGEIKAEAIKAGEMTASASLASEYLVLNVANIPSKEQYSYTGRGQFAKFKDKPYIRKIRIPDITSSHLFFWANVKGVVREIHNSSRRSETILMPDSIVSSFVRLLECTDAHTDSLSDCMLADVKAIKGIIPYASTSIWQRFLEICTSVYKHFLNARVNDIRNQWMQHVRLQLSRGGGLLFKYISQYDKQFLNVSWDRSGKHKNPNDFLNSHRKKWSSFWAPDENKDEIPKIVHELHEFRQFALTKDAPKFDCVDFDSALYNYNNDTLGIDLWSSTELKALPKCARQSISDSLARALLFLVIPFQIIMSLNSLLGKPSGDSRTICKTPMLYRIMCRADKDVRKWELDNARDFDTARVKSSALLAALKRNLHSEICFWLGMIVASIFNDFHKFFDTLCIVTLLVEAVYNDFPPRSMSSALMQHLAPRVLQVMGHSSAPSHVFRSILAGCRFSVPFTRNYLYRSLTQVVDMYPEANLSLFVDGTAMQAYGYTCNEVCHALVPAEVSFARKVRKLRLSLSPKAALSSSSPALQKLLARELSSYGLKFIQKKAARDLGISSSSGKCRAPEIINQRFSNSTNRIHRISKLAKISKKARVLFSGSAYSANTFGHQSCGLSDMQTRTLERDALACSGIPRAGRCKTFALAVAYGLLGSPVARIIRETVVAWFSILPQCTPQQIDDLRVAWSHAKNKMLFDHNVRHIHGIMSNLVYILIKAKWQPIAFNVWRDRNGSLWVIDGCVSSNIVAAAIAKSMFEISLVRAAAHHDGWGVQNGVDSDCTFQVVRNLKGSTSDYQLKCTVEALLAGTLWPGVRVNSIHPEFPATCPRCGSSDESSLHAYWQCPANECIHHEFVTKSNYLCQRATDNASELPCLWLRGIMPEHLTKISDEFLPTPVLSANYVNPDCCFWASGTYYGDASGGEHTEYPKLRRVGVGLAKIDQHGKLLFGIKSNVPGTVQTVSRGELYALALLVDHAIPGATYDFVTDNDGVFKVFNKGPLNCQSSSNVDLFKKIFKIISDKGLVVSVRWMPSHTDSVSQLPAGVTELDRLGNEHADTLAKAAAKSVRLPDAATVSHIHYYKLTRRIQLRIACIIMNLPVRQHQRECREVIPRPRLESLINESSHDIHRTNNRLLCKNCNCSFWIHDAALKSWLLCPCPHSNVVSATCSVRVQKNTLVSVGPLPASLPLAKKSRIEITSHSASSSSAVPFSVVNPASSSADEIGFPISRPQHVPIESGAIHIGNATIHHSHKIKTHRGLRYCGKCGCVATG